MGPCPDTCGCRRTCPPKARYAPPARRFASRRRGSARRGAARRCRFSHPADRGTRVPFVGRAPPASPSASTFASRPVRRSNSAASPREPGSASPSWSAYAPSVAPSSAAPTRRPSESCAASAACSKKVHVDSGGAYSQQTATALRTLRAAIARLAGHEPEGDAVIVKKVPTSKLRRAEEQGPQCARARRLHRRPESRRRRREGRASRAPRTCSTSTTTAQVQEMIDLAEVARRSPPARPALDHQLAGG